MRLYLLNIQKSKKFEQMKKSLIITFTFLLIASGCSDSKVEIKGKFDKGSSKEIIYLSKNEVNQYVVTDSAKIKKGVFTFKETIEGPTFYQVGFSNDEFVTILASPGEKISITFHSKTPNNNYSVKGSKGSADVKALDSKLYETKLKLDSLMSLYSDALTNKSDANYVREIEQNYEQLIKDQRKSNIEYIISNPSSFASILALYQQYEDQSYVLYDKRDLQYIKIVADTLSKYYPKSKIVMSVATDLAREKKLLLSEQLGDLVASAMETTLDPNLTDINGNRVALSSLRGKYVLLSFYSYTSQDCIDENLQLKELYKAYKNKGLEIYQINLDADEATWRSYVNYEELPWISVREDDPTYLANARLFNVRSIPATYLFDKDGNIIASNLHGRNLKIKLDQIFK